MITEDMNNEDEDVVIKGSSLYEHLHKFGYTDFESVTIERLMPKDERKGSVLSGLLQNVKNIFKKIYVTYLRMIQDDSASKKQMEIILNAKVLLNDHGCSICSFLDKYDCKPWRAMMFKFVLLGTILSSSVHMSCSTQYRNSANLIALTVLGCAGYIKYLRVNNTQEDLKSVISLQNDLFDFCKRGMKILRYGYKIKCNTVNSSQQFSDLTAGRLKYLQPIMENLVRFLEHISSTYYHVSLILVKLLPIDICNESLLTRFESTSFRIHGEINYQKLKTLYRTYMLTQSEMLHLFAIAYDNYTWRESYRKVPEFKLAYIVRLLIPYLTMHKNKLSEVIDAYYNFKLEPISYKYKGPDSSQWQDLYMHLYLASNKLQLAYSHVLSILQDIDNDIVENITSEDTVENTMQKLNAAQKCIGNAKDFIEFSSVFLVKTRNNASADNRLETTIPMPVAEPNVRTINDSEPEIMDEVFEEYIKEEYLKPLNEEVDEITLYNYKRDKALFKNFLTELKDALVDKKKSMSEREAIALQRMYKTIMKETTSSDECQRIPTPPPMPSFNTSLEEDNNELNQNFNESINLQLNEISEKSVVAKSMNKSDENLNEKNLGDIFMEEKASIGAIFLPIDQKFSSFLPPPFLKAEEETFIGSGENSEDDEIIEEEETKAE
ncbi:hypothetical protein ANTPLA_LOCUS7147 [Anthophora plagiata]